MALKPTPTPAPVVEDSGTIETIEDAINFVPEAREPGFHVMLGGLSLGCYPSAEDAELYADGHPRANGLTVTIEEVTA